MSELKVINTGNEFRLLNMIEASCILGIKVSTLYRLCMRKQIRFVKVGKLNRFCLSDLQNFVNERVVEKEN